MQTFSAEIVHACSALVGPAQVAIFSRNDRTHDLRTRFPDVAAVAGAGLLPHHLRRFAARPLAQRFRRGVRPELVISTHPQLNPAALSGAIPLLGVCHGIDAWNLSPALLRSLNRTWRVLAVSRYTRDRLLEQDSGLAPRTQVFPNTFDESRFQWGEINRGVRAALNISPEAFVLLAVTRLNASEAPKGYDDVIRCLPEIIRHRADTCFILAGRGADLSRVQRLAADLGVADHCRFPGFIPDGELADLYRAADVFSLPSRKEGFGIAFIEALACGAAVIAGNADGSRDALLDGELGQLIPPGDLSALTAAILQELQAPAARRRAEGRQRSERVHREFGRRAFRDRLLEQLTAARESRTQVAR